MTVKDINNVPALLRGMDAVLQEAAEEVGAYLESRLVNKIVQQDPGWAPLKPATIARKGSAKIWVDTGELMGLITHMVQGGIPKTVYVGIFNHEKGLIAKFIEYGTKDMPERPLFRLVFEEEKDKIQDILEKALERGIRKHLT